MSRRIRTVGAAALFAIIAAVPAGVSAQEPPVGAAVSQAAAIPLTPVTLEQALALAEANNPGLRLAQYQLSNARTSLATAPANAQNLGSLASLYAQAQFGVTIPANAITPAVARQQAQISYEQAAVQYYQARQQVRMGTLHAYVEWQRARSLVEAQQSALDRALAQEEQVTALMNAGVVAKFDLLQAQAQVTGQKAALAGAVAMEASTRLALEQVIGRPLAAGVVPESQLLSADTVVIDTDVAALVAKAMANRPDLRDSVLDLVARRSQVTLTAGSAAAAQLQIQVAAGQYESAAAKARTEVQQSLWAAQGALGELKAREGALAPSTEALRLAELRYEAGLATYIEVQSALAANLQAEAARIQAAANLRVALARLAQATGDM